MANHKEAIDILNVRLRVLQADATAIDHHCRTIEQEIAEAQEELKLSRLSFYNLGNQIIQVKRSIELLEQS